MTRRARWICVGALEAPALQSWCANLAQAQAAAAEPIVIWGTAPADLCVGLGAGAVWVDAGQHLFILIVPARLAPGRARRWISWALAPALAACRSSGLQAYFERDALWAAGRQVAGARCAAIGACAVIACSLPRVLPGEKALAARFRAAIEVQFDWQFETSWPSAAERHALAEAG